MTLVGGSLITLVRAHTLAVTSMRNVRQNLALALAGEQQDAEDGRGDGCLGFPDAPESADLVVGEHALAWPLVSPSPPKKSAASCGTKTC